MGYNAYSKVIYGISVKRRDLEKLEMKRGCKHKTDETKSFCADCGKSVWVQHTASVLDGLSDEPDNELGYFTESGDSSRNPNYQFMIGFKLASTGYRTRLGDENRDEVRQPTVEMKKELLYFIKTNGLKLKEEDIKMIVYTYHSY